MVLFSAAGFSQSLIMEESLLDTSISSVGPNRTHYAQFFEQFGVIPATSPTTNWLSGSFAIGGYYRLQLAQTVGIGVNGIMSFSRIGLQADSVGGNAVFRHRNTYNQLMGGPFVRIHFTRRGDFLGGYLDAGLLYSHTFRSKHKYSLESPDAQRVKVVEINGNSTRSWMPAYYGVLQYQHVGIYGIYRLESFDNQVELPKLEIGLRLAI